jgi:hypothetical protein
MAKKAKTTKKASLRLKGRGTATPKSAYERRIEKYLKAHPGATRAQARGHKEQAEHRTRERRERLKYHGLTIREKNAVHAFGIKQAHKDPENADSDAFAEQLVRWAGEHGYDKFRELVAEQQRLSKIKRERERRSVQRDGRRVREEIRGRFQSKRSHMQNFAERLGLPDWKVLFYH